MRSIDARVGTITASVLMTALMFSGIALAQAEEAGSEESPAIALLCLGPVLLFSLPFVVFCIVWMGVGPIMFLYGVLFSETCQAARAAARAAARGNLRPQPAEHDGLRRVRDAAAVCLPHGDAISQRPPINAAAAAVKDHLAPGNRAPEPGERGGG